jgi:hypothetical protein
MNPDTDQLIVSLIDKIDRSTTSVTVLFWPDGRRYEFPLSPEQATTLRTAMAPFVTAAQRADHHRRLTTGHVPSTIPDPERTQRIRSWARTNGHVVARTGPIPKSVTQEYDNQCASRPSVDQVINNATADHTDHRLAAGD